MVELINSDPTVLDALVTCDESWIYCYDPETKRQSSQWKHAALPDPRRPHRANLPTNFWWSLFLTALAMIYMNGVFTGQTVNKEYSVEVLREFRKRFRRNRPALFKSGQWHFQQDNAPVDNSILVKDYLTKMGINTVSHSTYSPDLAPCDFCLFPKLYRLSLWDKWGDKRGCDEGHWHAHTRGFDGAFQKLLKRYNKCITAGGDYFEVD